MNPNKWNTWILPSDSREMHPVPLLPVWRESGINSTLLLLLITKSVLASLRTAFLSCPLSLCGFRTICHKRHSYRLLIFAVSSPQPSWTAVKYIQRQEDRGRDRERAYYSSMSNRIQPIVSARAQETGGEIFAFNMSSNLLSSSLPSLPSPPRQRSTTL